MSARSIGVVLAHDDGSVVEAVGELLDSAADLFVAATSLDAAAGGSVIVAGGSRLFDIGAAAHPIVALADTDPIRSARAALEIGAVDIVAWPSEAARLLGAIRRAADPSRSDPVRGRIVSVAGARGGAGCSTVVAALGSMIDGSLVVDLDGGQRMFSDPLVASGSLPAHPTAEDLASFVQPHVGGARCLHLGGVRSVVPVRALATVSVVDAGRVPGAPLSMTSTDSRVVIVPNDVGSVRAAKDVLDGSTHVVIRRVRRDGVALKDIVASLGVEPVAVLPEERAVARAVDLGRLPPMRSRTMRVLARLARELTA